MDLNVPYCQEALGVLSVKILMQNIFRLGATPKFLMLKGPFLAQVELCKLTSDFVEN